MSTGDHCLFSSSPCYLSGNNSSNGLQTTPKLPKRERLASVSRLVASENFTELMPDKLITRKSNRRPFKKLISSSETLPDIRISLGGGRDSNSLTPENPGSTLDVEKIGYPGMLQLPFSPNLPCRSPKYTSPAYQQSPMRSPLYATEKKGAFLGRGSFGNVTLFIYKGKKYALKVVNDQASCIGEWNFINIRHPHLVSILHIAPILDKVFICMEFAGHCNLQQILDTKSELDFPRRLSFCIQIALGLRHCHQRRIVHGDVKPVNAMVSPLGVCKLGDFGHSVNLNRIPGDRTLQHVDIVGTAAYAAPEVLRGGQPTPPSDMYSFGILLWQVQTRETPFAGEHPHVIIYKVAHYGHRPVFDASSADFSEPYRELAESCWHEVPNKRPTISEALHNLQDMKALIKRNHQR